MLAKTRSTSQPFNPAAGIAEDPATGTAAGPLAARLVREGRLNPGADAIVEQGYRLGRPSHLRVTVLDGTVRLSGAGSSWRRGRSACEHGLMSPI